MKLRAAACMGLTVALIAGCNTSAHEAVAPGEAFASPFMSVNAPTSGKWQVRSKSDTGITFASGKAGSTFIASVMLFRLGPANTPEEYEKLIRDDAAKDVDPEHPDRYQLLEQTIKYSTERPYPCVRYRATSMDNRAKGTSEPQFLELDGLYCRHPMDDSAGAVIMYSHRGLARDPDLRTKAEAFIRNAKLPSN